MHIRHWIFAGLIILVFGYFFFEARGVLFGPELEIFEPKEGESFNTTLIHVAGRTIPQANVWVAGRIITSDEKGIFEENLTFHPGLNAIGVLVKDHFGNEAKKTVQFYIK